MPTLLITDQRNGEQRSHDIPTGASLAMGRMEGQDVVLNHNKVSRKHAKLTEEDGIVKILDNGSSNGTYLNGKRLAKGEETIIFAGDEIRIAEFTLKLQEDGVVADAEHDDEDEVTPPGEQVEEPAPPEEPAEEHTASKAQEPVDASPLDTTNSDAARGDDPIDSILEEYGKEIGEGGDAPDADPGSEKPSPKTGAIDLDALSAAPPRKSGSIDLLELSGGAAPKKPAASLLDDDDEPAPTRSPSTEDIVDEWAAEDRVEDAPVEPAPREEPAPTAASAPRSTYGFSRSEKKETRKGRSDEEQKKLEIIYGIKGIIQDRILQYMDLRNLDFTKAQDQELREKTTAVIRDIIAEMGDKIPRWASKKQIAKEVLDEALGLGPLEDLLADESVTEVMVNSKDRIYIERKGRIEEAPVHFSSDQAVMAVIERIVGPIGRRIDESSPMVDARLKDGSRVNAIIPPLALKGPCITIRKFSKTPFTLENLISFGTLTEDIAHFLQGCVGGRLNIIVSGGTGSGKTTLLNVLSNFIPTDERIITIENVAELRLGQEHVVCLESRPPNIEGRGEISIRELVKNSLRMRPDRIVVGECRGAETIDMIQAMNTGHDGSLTTLHSNAPSDTLHRLETMSLMAGFDLPMKAIREQIMSAVHLIVHTNRFSDGSRRISHVTEVLHEVDEHYRIQTKDIFRFHQAGIDDDGTVIGSIQPTGYIPSFLDELGARGFAVEERLFSTRK